MVTLVMPVEKADETLRAEPGDVLTVRHGEHPNIISVREFPAPEGAMHTLIDRLLAQDRTPSLHDSRSASLRRAAASTQST